MVSIVLPAPLPHRDCQQRRSVRARRLEETKKRAKNAYIQRKTLTVHMETVEGKLLEQRVEGYEELAEQLRE